MIPVLKKSRSYFYKTREINYERNTVCMQIINYEEGVKRGAWLFLFIPKSKQYLEK